jgi:5'(3')-deoxyribonucleotidase
MKTIAIDYDGTIAHTSEVKADWIRDHVGMKIPGWKTDRTSCVPIIGSQNYERMGQFVYEREGSLRARDVPGSLDAMKELARNFMIFIVTARKSHQIRWCKEWLRERGLDSLIHAYFSTAEKSPHGSPPSKLQVCRDHNIGVLIDDDERHLEGSEVPHVRRILLKSGCTEMIRVPEGAELARSWSEALRILRAELE